MKQLLKNRDGLQVYDAGLPRFPRNFTRDSIISALLANDMAMMREQLRFCALHQGQKRDAETGEEVGKIHHEWPGYPIRDRMTTYNACDATAFFLLGHAAVIHQTNDHTLFNEQSAAIDNALTYILNHINEDGLFEESPSYCGAEQFALKVTYWKDSVVLGRPNGEPNYPAVFTLAHVQNLAAVRAIARLRDDETLHDVAWDMLFGLARLWDEENGNFYVAQDEMGMIRAVTSDSLHALYYLNGTDLSGIQVEAIERSSEVLETSIGYMNMRPEDAPKVDYNYHANTIWPFEQALIHAGAGKFGLARVQRVCERVLRAVDGRDPETLQIRVTTEDAPSCDPQLWTIAAKQYFAAV